MAPNEKRVFHEKVESDLEKCRRISVFDENMKVRGSIYDHFPISTFSRGATRNSFFRKEFGTCRFQFSENHRKMHEMVSERRSRGPDTWNPHEISIRIQWRRSRTPKSGFWGRKYTKTPDIPPPGGNYVTYSMQ